MKSRANSTPNIPFKMVFSLCIYKILVGCIFDLNDSMNSCWKVFSSRWQLCFEAALCAVHCLWVFVFRWPPPIIFHIAYAFQTLSFSLSVSILVAHTHTYKCFCWFHSFPYIIAIVLEVVLSFSLSLSFKSVYFDCLVEGYFGGYPPTAGFSHERWQVKTNLQISTLHCFISFSLASLLFSFESHSFSLIRP